MQSSKLGLYAGKKVRVICLECDLFRTFDGNELLADFGDASMPWLLDSLHSRVGCDRPMAGFYDRCALTYHFTHEEWIEKAGLVSREEYEIAIGKRLDDLKEWETLDAICKCGRRGRLNRKSLTRQFGGQARIKDLSARLLCQKCKKYDSVIQIAQLPR